MWQAMVSQDNPRPLNRSHYALAIGSQAYCMGGAGIYTAPTMAGPWSFQGSLYNQMVPEPEVSPKHTLLHACRVAGPWKRYCSTALAFVLHFLVSI